MYSREKCCRAVDLYFVERLSLREVVAKLGWPSAAALAEWVRADPRFTSWIPVRTYTMEQKVRAARMMLATGDTKRVAAQIGCTSASVLSWTHAYASKGGAALIGRRDKHVPPQVPRSDSSDTQTELQRQIDELRLQNAIMRETINVLKAADPRLDPDRLNSREKTRVVQTIRTEFGLGRALRAVRLPRSTFYYESGVIAAGDKYAALRDRIRRLFVQGNRVWGYRTIHAMLRLDRTQPLRVSEKVVRRVMREEHLRPVYLRKRKTWSSYKGEVGIAPANLVRRDFHAGAPNQLWLTDVTQFTMDGYKCYLSPVIDCFDGMIVSWTLSHSPNALMANTMLRQAIGGLNHDEHPIIHSDRGVHYRWDEWIRICRNHGITRSMSSKGCSPDNSAAEGFFGRLKNEFYHGRDWHGVTYQAFEERLTGYLTHYNQTRIKQSLGWKSPIQYRQDLGLVT